MSLFIVRLAHHAMNCSEQTGSGVPGVERTKGHGWLQHKGPLPGKMVKFGFGTMLSHRLPRRRG